MLLQASFNHIIALCLGDMPKIHRLENVFFIKERKVSNYKRDNLINETALKNPFPWEYFFGRVNHENTFLRKLLIDAYFPKKLRKLSTCLYSNEDGLTEVKN